MTPSLRRRTPQPRLAPYPFTGPHRPPPDPWTQLAVVVLCVAGLGVLWLLAALGAP